MKRTQGVDNSWQMVRNSFILFLGCLGLATFPSKVRSETYTLNSSELIWNVTDVTGSRLNPGPDLSYLRGKPRHVCLNSSSPQNCPTGSLSFGYPGNDWPQIQGAAWIWANVDPTSHPGDTEGVEFQASVWMCGNPVEGSTITIAADDIASVFVNSSSIGVANGFATPTVLNVPAAALSRGLNLITVQAANSVLPGCTSYSCNPAGIALTASFKDDLPQKPSALSQRYESKDAESFPRLNPP